MLCILQLDHVDVQSACFSLTNAKWNLQSLCAFDPQIVFHHLRHEVELAVSSSCTAAQILVAHTCMLRALNVCRECCAFCSWNPWILSQHGSFYPTRSGTCSPLCVRSTKSFSSSTSRSGTCSPFRAWAASPQYLELLSLFCGRVAPSSC